MGFSGALLYFPAFPFNVEVLRPSLALASAAGSLNRCGHEVQVMDMGTVETFERIFPIEMRPALLKAAQSMSKGGNEISQSPLSVRWRLRGLERCAQKHQEGVAAEVATELVGRRALDFVAIRIVSTTEIPQAVSLAQRVREEKPKCVLLAYGPGVADEDRGLRPLVRAFDGVLPGEPLSSLAGVVELLHDREKWAQIPYLRTELHPKPRSIPTGPLRSRGAIAPAYESYVYPALAESTKVKVFDLEHIVYNNRESTCNVGSPMGAKSTKAMVDEVVRLKRMYKCHAFHFKGAAPFSKDPELLASEFLLRRLPIRYSREGHISGTNARTISSLKASGCHAMSFVVDSGSQHLLEEYFNRPFSVSQIERVLRTARFMNLHIDVVLTYPTEFDDFHTREETIRLIERTRPHSASVRFSSKTLNRMSARQRSASQREQYSLLRALAAGGTPSQISPQMALMASLCDYKSREEEFCRQLHYQFFTGDVIGVATTVELINRGACTPSHMLEHDSEFMHENVVGN